MSTLDFKKILVKRIKTYSFSINEALFKHGKEMQSEIALNFGFNIETNYIDISLTFFFHYPNSADNISSISVQNIYEIPNLSSFIQIDKIILPEELIISLVSMSIGHTRALFAMNTAGTLLNDAIFPVADAKDVSKHFFPDFFVEK